MKEWIESSLGYNRFSPEFLRQLTEHGANKVGNYYNKYTKQYEEIYYNVFVILDKIKKLEENAFNKNIYKPLRNFGIIPLRLTMLKSGNCGSILKTQRFTKRNRSSKLLNRLTNLGLRIRYWLMRKVK